MTELLPFFIILFAGVFFSVVFRRIHVPWVVALIVGGILLGPHGLNVLSVTPTVEFISQIGLIFLMFMAGLETRLSSFAKFQKGLLWLSFVNGFVPFLVGVGIGLLFGYGWVSSLLVGIIFVSSSIAVVIPSLESFDLLHTKLGQAVVMTSVIQDVASLVMLSFLLQNIRPIANISLVVFYPLLIIVLVVFRYVLPKISRFLISSLSGSGDVFQQDFRSTFLILIGTVLAFELLGLHPIIAGFFAGLVLSQTIKSKILKVKIRTISYGIFIPTFFLIIGAKTDIGVFKDVVGTLPIILSVVFGSVLSKLLSGWVGGRMVGYSGDESLLFAVSSVPQLSTTLAVAFTALSLGYIDQKLITAMVVLSVATVLVSPTLMALFERRIKGAIETRS